MNIFKWYKIYRNLNNENYFYLLPNHIVVRVGDLISVISRRDFSELSNAFSWKNLMWIKRNIESNPDNWKYLHRIFLHNQFTHIIQK